MRWDDAAEKWSPPRRRCARFSSSLSHFEDTRLKNDRNSGTGTSLFLCLIRTAIQRVRHLSSHDESAPPGVLLLYERHFISLDLTGFQLITRILELHLNTSWTTFWSHSWCSVTSSLRPGMWTLFHPTCLIPHTLTWRTHAVAHVNTLRLK